MEAIEIVALVLMLLMFLTTTAFMIVFAIKFMKRAKELVDVKVSRDTYRYALNLAIEQINAKLDCPDDNESKNYCTTNEGNADCAKCWRSHLLRRASNDLGETNDD